MPKLTGVQAEFAKRMFVYNYRIFDRYDRPVASMAVLADDSVNWKPQDFGFEVLGCKHTLVFPVAKLLDYAAQEQTLADNPNPFALVTLAHLQTRATRQDPQARYEAKWRLVQLLYRRGWDKQRILDLFFVLDWMMTLPEHLKTRLWQNLNSLEQEKKMAYISSVERIGIEKGMQQGMNQGFAKAVALQLQMRFGPVPQWAHDRLSTANEEQLTQWLGLILTTTSVDELFATDGPVH